ncbi:CarD family transcriptional regulator [Myxococcota bacterium]|nr:CarD family transcriptional regulator [Myxococcota bacterium]MBU1382102.1 CarD family transcriptional regulator [Myxococcota bacterium]MBU1498104.1 CarD family transcriptional regulator [Myxococcota bacterium]
MADIKFEVGGMVAYPGQGVAEIAGVIEKSLGGSVIIFFELVMLETGIKIMVPVHKAEAVGLRKLITTDEVKLLFDILGTRDVVFDKQTWNRRYRGFVEKIKTGSLFDVAEVFRDLSLLKFKKTLSFGEKRMLETAKALIQRELCVVQEKTDEEVEKDLEDIFKDVQPAT